MQVNDVKDLRPFRKRAQPVWKFLEGKVGKELFDRVIAKRAQRSSVIVDLACLALMVALVVDVFLASSAVRAPGDLPVVRRGRRCPGLRVAAPGTIDTAHRPRRGTPAARRGRPRHADRMAFGGVLVTGGSPSLRSPARQVTSARDLDAVGS